MTAPPEATIPMQAPMPQRGMKGGMKRNMVRGTMWTTAQRWSSRLMGLVTTMILARLLTPADFGIVAIAGVIVGMVEVFSRTGFGAAIVRHPDPTREHYDSAWTFSLLLGLGLGLVIWILTPLTTAYFHEPRAAVVVEILALRTMLIGSRNIGVVNFQRNLQFDKTFWFNFLPSLASLVATVTAAFLLRSYWALVIGVLVEHVTTFLLSYAMEPYRPRLCFRKVQEIWSFSFWVLFLNIATYLSGVVDRLAIGGFAGSAAMGRYFVADDIATQSTKELTGPVVQAFFPVLAGVHQDVAKRRQLYLSVLYVSALICTSTAIGIWLVGDDMVDLVLGPQWTDVKPLIPLLAFAYGVFGLSAGIYTALYSIGLPRLASHLQWMWVIGLALVIFPTAYLFRDLVAIATARLAFTVVVTPVMFYTLMKPYGLTVRDYAVTLWRPLAAGLTMAVVVLAVNHAIGFTGNWRLFLDVGVGLASYVGALMLLWLAVGRPGGPEQELLTFLRRKRK